MHLFHPSSQRSRCSSSRSTPFGDWSVTAMPGWPDLTLRWHLGPLATTSTVSREEAVRNSESTCHPQPCFEPDFTVAFSPTSTADQLLKSKCTSCGVAQDFSAYWAPAMYYIDPNGNAEIVPGEYCTSEFLTGFFWGCCRKAFSQKQKNKKKTKAKNS